MAIVCVDAGTTLVKAVVFAADGREQAVEREALTVQRPRPGWAEQDMADVWTAVARTVRAAVARTDERVDFLAFTAQGDGCWLVDRAGDPTGPAVLWNDGRATGRTQGWIDDGVLDKAFRINGSLSSAGMPNAVLSWLQEHDPQRLAASAACLTCGGWLFSQLTGEVAADESDAAAPFLDITTRQYSPELVALFGLDDLARLLPPLRRDDDRVAPLTAAAAEATGLTVGLPVVMAPYDIVSTAVGSGAVALGQTCTVLGTTLCTEVVTGTVRLDGVPAGLTIPSGAPGRLLRAFPTLAGAGVLTWACRLLGLGGAGELGTLAASSPAGARGLSFLPYLSPGGERAPFLDPSVRGLLAGITLEHGPEDIARAVFEGLSLVVADCLRASGSASLELRACGGGAASDLWLQMIADMTRLPVVRSADSEVGARGAMLVGSVATGAAPDVEQAAHAHVRDAARFQPDDAAAAQYGDAYEAFLALRPASRRPVLNGRAR